MSSPLQQPNKTAQGRTDALSVVIPTYNRGRLVVETIEACLAHAGGVELEFVVIDDGSKDDTAARLASLAERMPNLVWRTQPNSGPGQARNLGASLARHDVILFLGDDIQPVNDSFFRVHADLHRRNPSTSLAVLGKVIWPNHPDFDMTFVMSHIQGRGGEQFGYAHLDPFTELNWRFFYTANISVKKRIVQDWMKDGFSHEFRAYGYEDIEFAYRVFRSPGGLTIYYDPTSLGTHYHHYSVETFINRQISAGMMADVFRRKHPEVADEIGIGDYIRQLNKPGHPNDDTVVPDYLSVIEGIKSWARILDRRHKMGSQHWHEDLLKALFELCYAQGFLMAWSEPDANHAAAYELALDRFNQNVRGLVHREVTGHRFPVQGLLPDLASPPMAALAQGDTLALKNRLRAWARRKPMIVSAYRTVRRFL